MLWGESFEAVKVQFMLGGLEMTAQTQHYGPTKCDHVRLNQREHVETSSNQNSEQIELTIVVFALAHFLVSMNVPSKTNCFVVSWKNSVEKCAK